MDNKFSLKIPLKVGIFGGSKDHGRSVLIKVYWTEARSLLDSGAMPNALLKKFVDRLGIELEKTKRRITAVTEEKSQMVGMIKVVTIHLDEKILKLRFLFVQGSLYDVIVDDATIESIEGVLDLGPTWDRS